MVSTSVAISFVIGLALGAFGAGLLYRRRRELAAEAMRNFDAERERLLDAVRTAFASLSRDALSANSDDFLRLAKTRLEQESTHAAQVLDGKKQLIDAQLGVMTSTLSDLHALLQTVDRERATSHGSLEAKLEKTSQATLQLQVTTAKLQAALSNPQARGQWGERMAEDLLRTLGFIRGVNYERQETPASGNRPDYTFLLPQGKKVHMDVKFPLANYLKLLEATDEQARDPLRAQFLRDVRNRIKEVGTREYIDPANGTVDYVLVFIPNEQVYGFIHEHDRDILDDALRQKVVLCSPLTLYAILSVIRQAAEQFRFEQGAKQILQILGEFRKQWGKYVESMAGLGDKLDAAARQYQELMTTRTKQLDRPLARIDELAVEPEPIEKDRSAVPLGPSELRNASATTRIRVE